MLRTGGNDDDSTRCDRLPPVDKDRFALALDKEQDLIVVCVRFLADLAAGRYAHQHDLRAFSRIQYPPEIVVLYGLMLYVSHIWLIRYVYFHSGIVRRSCEARKNFIGGRRYWQAGGGAVNFSGVRYEYWPFTAMDGT